MMGLRYSTSCKGMKESAICSMVGFNMSELIIQRPSLYSVGAKKRHMIESIQPRVALTSAGFVCSSAGRRVWEMEH